MRAHEKNKAKQFNDSFFFTNLASQDMNQKRMKRTRETAPHTEQHTHDPVAPLCFPDQHSLY